MVCGFCVLGGEVNAASACQDIEQYPFIVKGRSQCLCIKEKSAVPAEPFQEEKGIHRE